MNCDLTGGIYRHFKGGLYKVIGVGKHSETHELLVVYVNVKNEKEMWIRPINNFLDKVSLNGELVSRFELMKDKSL